MARIENVIRNLSVIHGTRFFPVRKRDHPQSLEGLQPQIEALRALSAKPVMHILPYRLLVKGI